MSIVIGLIIGAVLGLTGAGGSIFAVPLLILLLGLAPADAMGIALAAVSVSAFLGSVAQRKDIVWLPALALALSGAVAAPFGKYLSTMLNDSLLVIGFAAIALAIATRMLLQSLNQPESANYVRALIPEEPEPSTPLACKLSPTGQFQLKPRCLSGLFIGGSLIGIASGLFGVGGGFLIIPLLLFLSSLTMPKSIATSLATITFISGSGFIAHIALSGASNNESMNLLPMVLIGATVGMLLSQGFARLLAGPRLQQIFSILLVLVVAMLLGQQFLF